MKQFFITLFALSTIACGGGGGESTPQKTPDVVTDGGNGSDNSGTAGLNVAPEFDFKTDVTVIVDVAANLVNERAFINICQVEAILTHEDNCLLRAPLTSDGLQISLTLPHAGQKIKADIWYYDTSMSPMRYEWQYDVSQDQQKWLIN